MRLIAYSQTNGHPWRAAVATDGGHADVAELSGGQLPASPSALLALEDWPALLRELPPGPASVPLDARIGPPQPAPAKLIAVGLNYRDHCRESKAEIPERPLLFAKWPNAIIGPDAPIVLPDGATSQLDYEVELAAVIGRRCSGVSAERALEHVGGYTISNDISARDVQFRDGQWTFGKSFDTFCPLGPALVTADSLPDPQALAIGATVNGEPRQRSSTAEMVFSVAELVAYISTHVTLEPGDVVLTGTPAGVGLGFEPPRWLTPGDVVRCEVGGIGALANPVVNGAGP